MANYPPCSRCGTAHGFVVHGQAAGPVLTYYDANGHYLEQDFDKVYSRQSTVVRCSECGKVRRDAVHGDMGIEAKAP